MERGEQNTLQADRVGAKRPRAQVSRGSAFLTALKAGEEAKGWEASKDLG